MPEQILQQKIYPYDGSFDATKHPLLISAKDVVDSQNIVYTTYSTKKKRPGISSFLPIRLPGNRRILAGIDFWRLGVQKIVIYNGRQILAIDPRTGTSDDIGINFKVPIDVPVNFLAFSGLLIVCFGDGVTSPKAWVGSGVLTDLHSSAPIAPFCRVWLNRIWMPDPTVQGRLLYSKTGSVEFTGGDSGALDLDVNDGDPDGITAIFPPLFGFLYVAKRFSLYRVEPITLQLSGQLVFSPKKFSDGIGCISHNAVSASPNNVFFPSDEGIHYLAATDKISGAESNEFSVEIQPLWLGQTNYQRSKYMWGFYDKNLKSYLLLYPSESQLYPNDLWGFSTNSRKWYRWREYNQTCLFRYVDRITKKLLTVVGSKDGDLGFIDENNKNDYATPISVSLRTGIICPAGSPDDEFTFKAMAPIFVPQLSGEFKVTYKIDGKVIETQTFNMIDDTGGDLLGINFIVGQSYLGGVPQVKVDKRTIIGNGMLYEIFIDHEGVGDGDDGFEILGILMDVDRIQKKLGRTVA